MTDLARYISANDFLIDLEARQQVGGSHQAFFDWLRQSVDLDRDEMNYVLEGHGRLLGDPRAEGWDPGRPELDGILWAFRRAWLDRYGWAATNDEGLRRWRDS